MEKETRVAEETEPPNSQKETLQNEETEPPSQKTREDYGYYGVDEYLTALAAYSKKEHGYGRIPSKRLKFIKNYFPDISISEWNDWKWQIKNSVKSAEELSKFVNLTEEEFAFIEKNQSILPLRVTPYYASLLAGTTLANPLTRSVVPIADETVFSPDEENDPLSEELQSPVENLVHRYPDRVLFLVTGFCSTYCRYCTRSRYVGENHKCENRNRTHENAFEYIKNHKEIRDVIISGGDPLTLPDETLEKIVSRIRQIPHVEIIRIGTKVPAVLPQRITSNLIKTLKKFNPLYINIHFTHPEEITEETAAACRRLADGGFPLGSQTVLLKGINDSPLILKELFHKLLAARVRPYYLYQCDKVLGTSHFRTEIEEGIEIIKQLRGFTSGLAMPNYIVDLPKGGGKIALLPNYVKKEEKGNYTFCNFKGDTYGY
ncbi:KamA family radical SAM protein [candidate division WOR-3 bacterium]|nr:KamA family radical SAM protein [candidate division WOR-3 bacterium]